MIDWTVNVGDLVLFVAGGAGGAAVTRNAAIRRLHVEHRAEVVTLLESEIESWPIDQNNALAIPVPLSDAARQRVTGIAEMLPLLDRLVLVRLEYQAATAFEAQPPGGPDHPAASLFHVVRRFYIMRLRTSVPARWWVFRRQWPIYWWGLGYWLTMRRLGRKMRKQYG